MNKCLMIQTKDKRKFFTHKKNMLQLAEFSKTFDAEMSVVKLQEKDMVLDLPQLVPAICNTNYETHQEPHYEVIEILLPKSKRSRSNILEDASKIQEYIKERFLKGNTVSLKDTYSKFKQSNLTKACICTHIKKVRQKLSEEGFEFRKVGGGKYELI